MRSFKFLITGLAFCITSMLCAYSPVAASPGVAHATNISKIEKSIAPAFSLNLTMQVHLDITNLTAENGIKISNFIKAMDADPAVKLIIVNIDCGACKGGDAIGTARVSEAMQCLKVRYARNSSFLAPEGSDWYVGYSPPINRTGWIEIPIDISYLEKRLHAPWLKKA